MCVCVCVCVGEEVLGIKDEWCVCECVGEEVFFGIRGDQGMGMCECVSVREGRERRNIWTGECGEYSRV